MSKDEVIVTLSQLERYLIGKGWDMGRVTLPKQSDLNSFILLIPPYYVDLIDWYNPDDPLRLMILTDIREREVKEYEREDPIGDLTHSPVPGIVHRYPNRCLLMVTNACAVHCRFCFRKDMLAHNRIDLSEALAYIAQHPQIWEVILTGGDPLVLSDDRIKHIIELLAQIPHIKMVRIHTRTPAVYPTRVTPAFMQAITSRLSLSIVLHVNHPREVTPAFAGAVRTLSSQGALLLSQSVLMKGVNDTTPVLRQLFEQLVLHGIKPYYLYHLDKTKGTSHFRISIREGLSLLRSLRGYMPGHCIPTYILDIPGGLDKVPVESLTTQDGHSYTGVSYTGETFTYEDPSI